MASINRQLKRLAESGDPSPREVDKAVTRLAQLGERLEKPSTASRRNSTRRDDSTTNSAPSVRPTPTSEQPGRPHDDNTNHVIAQALHQLVQQRQNRGAIATNGGQWRSVPQYWAKKKERLRHRPAKVRNAAVQAYRRRIIWDTRCPGVFALSDSLTAPRYNRSSR